MQYRPEIDGLRAIAVGGVVLAHAGVETLAGGFVGVDVFFVISGYLITSIILSDYASGQFSFSNFYYRRARRILPALFFVILVCLPFAWWLMTPKQLMEFGRSIGATAIFLSNVHFWRNTGYFDTSSELLPLLHTWSLGVEEQFYLLFPIVILAARWLSPRALPVVLPVMILMSLATAHLGAIAKPDVNFFFSLSRFWEILIGAFIALFPKAPRKSWHGIATFIGLSMIFSTYIGFSSSTPTPSLLTLLPVAGTALVLAYGNHPGWANSFLTLPFIVGLGVISFSIYLWHQPVLAFARLYFVTEIPWLVVTSLVVGVVGISFLSWKFVEQPVRRNDQLSRPRVFALSGFAITCYFLIGLGLKENDLGAYRYSSEEQKLLRYGDTYRDSLLDIVDSMSMTSCFDDGTLTSPPNWRSCVGANLDSPTVWGDSHAHALATGFVKIGVRPGLIAISGCPPVLVETSGQIENACSRLNQEALSVLDTAPKGAKLILHADWVLSVDSGQGKFSTSDLLIEQLSQTLQMVRTARPDLKVVIVGGVPQWGEGLPIYLFRLGLGLDDMHRIEPSRQDHILDINSKLRRLAVDQRVAFLDPFDVLCGLDGCLATFDFQGEIVPTSWDYGHLTAEGASIVANRLLNSEQIPQ